MSAEKGPSIPEDVVKFFRELSNEQMITEWQPPSYPSCLISEKPREIVLNSMVSLPEHSGFLQEFA